MVRLLVSFVLLVFSLAAASAQTITDPKEVAAKLRFWSQDAGEPVYYGEVRNVNPRGMKVMGHYQCLALAFIKNEDGVISYAHKMWSKSKDGSCHYDDVTTKKVGNHGACVKDSAAGFGKAVGTAAMSKDNIDVANSRFRAIDLNKRRVGETAACVPPKGVGAGLYSMTITNGRFRVMTTRPLDYEVNLEAQDPKKPPTAPVF